MDPRPLTWALVLLGTALALALGSAPAPEAREKLCGHHFVRALVRLCGGPRWNVHSWGPECGCGSRVHTSGWGSISVLSRQWAFNRCSLSICAQDEHSVSCCSGWKDDISTGWWPKGTPRWFSFHSPCPRPLAITTAGGGQRPPTLPTTAASAAAPAKTC
ncbi:hypothetical protein PANDA_000533, partial [Ailuropoda melanoleuca]